MRLHVRALRRLLLAREVLQLEFSFVDVDANDPERDIIARLWNVLTFRPDASHTVERLCRSDEIGVDAFADLLREASDAADWSEHFW